MLVVDGQNAAGLPSNSNQTSPSKVAAKIPRDKTLKNKSHSICVMENFSHKPCPREYRKHVDHRSVVTFVQSCTIVYSREHRKEQCQIPRQALSKHPRDESSELFGIERNFLFQEQFGTQTIGEGFQHNGARYHDQKMRTGLGDKQMATKQENIRFQVHKSTI
jgi:hypothetical protein